jgi:hypothetical protein
VVVPVAVVCRVPVAVVHVVDVVTVGHRDMAAALAVRVGVTGVLMVAAALALVRVPFVPTVQMTVVHVVDVIVVGDRHVPAALAVHMLVSRVRPVLKGCRHATHLHRFGPLHRRSGDVHLFGISTPARKNATADTPLQTSYRPQGKRQRFP